MQGWMKVLGVVLVVSSANAFAQTVTGSGTSGAVPVFNGTSTVTSSPISISGGNVGIGTTSPNALLEVNGAVLVDNSLIVANGVSSYTWGATIPVGNYVNVLSIPAGHWGTSTRGILSINSTFPYARTLVTYSLNLQGSGTTSNVSMISFGGYLGGNAPFSLVESGDGPLGAGSLLLNLYNNSPSAISVTYTITLDGTSFTPTYYNNPTPTVGVPAGHVAVFGSFNAPSEAASLNVSGNVGIGTTTPGATPPPGYIAGTPILEVNGDIVLTNTTGGAITFRDGTTQSSAWTGTLCGGDYAESVDVTGNRTNYEPGDVLVLDADNPGKMLKSIEAYSTSVSGIYSTKPGTVGRRQTTEKSPDEVPMAVVGIVPAKVSAENGSVKVGDLLVTSSTPGYAMKGTDRSRMLGAVVGKAMAKLDSGTGVIEVLVTLQ
jgi:hypothetical protein